jgi:hypothetical protein
LLLVLINVHPFFHPFLQVLGEVGALPDVFSELEVNFFLLRRLLGVRSKEGEKQSKVRHDHRVGAESGWSLGLQGITHAAVGPIRHLLYACHHARGCQ